ncbi:nuclear transport factor 2 family protein [Noviherbaspirillum malthae]|jgi:hypothetical protein|uniref:nuclear transport factor 2 family protein n=1 Tax=Noviherbaspirillum malthae TaxID=1260987 RepID=UPI0018904F13|nr:nuclear transport factor 2 family protein [Noviherbaspirillum malthae]
MIGLTVPMSMGSVAKAYSLYSFARASKTTSGKCQTTANQVIHITNGSQLLGIVMESMNLCRRYLAAINSSSLADVLALFESENAPILSPAHGLMPASAYFPKLFGNSETSIVRIRHVFEALAQGPSIALHYHHTRISTCGQVTEFDGVDIFEFSESREKFKKLTVIYDPTKISVSRPDTKFNPGVMFRPSTTGDETRRCNFELNFDSPRQEA